MRLHSLECSCGVGCSRVPAAALIEEARHSGNGALEELHGLAPFSGSSDGTVTKAVPAIQATAIAAIDRHVRAVEPQ